MDRTEAKAWAEISQEKLKIIQPNLAKHYEVLKAYADGCEIQYRVGGLWFDCNSPEFDVNTDYTIKPKLQEGSKMWAPRFCDIYYFITELGDVVEARSGDDCYDKKRIKFNNYFRSRGEAEFASKRIRETLLELKKAQEEQNENNV